MKFQSFYFKLYKRFSELIFKTLYLRPRDFCIPSVQTVFWGAHTVLKPRGWGSVGIDPKASL